MAVLHLVMSLTAQLANLLLCENQAQTIAIRLQICYINTECLSLFVYGGIYGSNKKANLR